MGAERAGEKRERERARASAHSFNRAVEKDWSSVGRVCSSEVESGDYEPEIRRFCREEKYILPKIRLIGLSYHLTACCMASGSRAECFVLSARKVEFFESSPSEKWWKVVGSKGGSDRKNKS